LPELFDWILHSDTECLVLKVTELWRNSRPNDKDSYNMRAQNANYGVVCRYRSVKERPITGLWTSCAKAGWLFNWTF